MWIMLIIGVILVAPSISLSSALSFNLDSFESVPPGDVELNGDAIISGAGLELNRATTRSAGRALYQKPMQLFVINHGNTAELADFSCHFAFDVSITASSNYSQGGGGGRRLLGRGVGGGGGVGDLGDLGGGGGEDVGGGGAGVSGRGRRFGRGGVGDGGRRLGRGGVGGVGVRGAGDGGRRLVGGDLGRDGSEGGDGGFSFVMVGDEDSKWSTSRYGGLLGLFDSNAAAVGGGHVQNHGVVAVEFDEGLDPLWDFSSDHVGIDVNSLKSKRYVNLTGGGFMNKGTVNVLVAYNSTTNNLSVSITFAASLGSVSVFHIVDLRDVLPQRVKVGFTASTGSASVVRHRITSWSFSSPDLIIASGRDGRVYIWKMVGLGAVLFILAAILVGISMNLYRWLNLGTTEDGPSRRLIDNINRSETHQEPAAPLDDCGVEQVPYESIREATENFSSRFKLGKGGSGAVYRCKLGNREEEIAVKKIKNGTQGLKEFKSELGVVSKARHRNVVKLVCWSSNSADLLLGFEYMPKGSLDTHIRLRGKPLLPWNKRYKVMCGVAAGVDYLHNGLQQQVIHRDIKAANVLLDIDYTAKVADFGVSRFAERGQSMKTTVEYGTYFYAAPDVSNGTNKASTKSDVYSFGILLLEVVTGRQPGGEVVQWVRGFYAKGDILAAVDPSLGKEFDPIQAKRLLLVGLQCCESDPDKRPPMKDVVSMLNDPDSTCRLLDPPRSSTAEHGLPHSAARRYQRSATFT